jgi:hypothetical protein
VKPLCAQPTPECRLHMLHANLRGGGNHLWTWLCSLAGLQCCCILQARHCSRSRTARCMDSCWCAGTCLADMPCTSVNRGLNLHQPNLGTASQTPLHCCCHIRRGESQAYPCAKPLLAPSTHCWLAPTMYIAPSTEVSSTPNNPQDFRDCLLRSNAAASSPTSCCSAVCRSTCSGA